MLIKLNSKESLEIVDQVFVNLINEDGAKYLSWDEMSEKQQECYSKLVEEFSTVYEKYKPCML
ncbi:MAG: hypothetical protein C0622_07155 [Desulfuromonas sp.]|nr:MAG: hypothetical protein C0622_07155 [Desulfuromonas sp.]